MKDLEAATFRALGRAGDCLLDSKMNAQLIRNSKAKCERCKGRRPASKSQWNKWMVYHNNKLFCVPCAATIGEMTEAALILKIRPTDDKLFPNKTHRMNEPRDL